MQQFLPLPEQARPIADKERCRLPFFEAGGKSRQELAKKEGGRR